MKTIDPKLIVQLYNWTRDDINQIYDKCFYYNHLKNRVEGPSNSYALIIASMFDLWGSIFRDEFGKYYQDVTKNNVEEMFMKICELSDSKKDDYLIFDVNGQINKNLTDLFRHNLAHDFGKKTKSQEFNLNIDCSGHAVNFQHSNGRWHFNCEKLKSDLLDVIRIELPKLLK